MPIIVGVAAAIIVIWIASSSLIKARPNDTPIDLDGIPTNSLQNMPMSESIKDDSQAYKINTQCEILFGLTAGIYPDGTPLPRGEIKVLVEKYPKEFKEWKTVLEDPEKSKEFVKNIPQEFNDILIPVLMKEALMNPNLTSTAMLVVDPQRNTKIKQVYDENECKEFFDSHSPNTTP